jgi:hypothetical protein
MGAMLIDPKNTGLLEPEAVDPLSKGVDIKVEQPVKEGVRAPKK